MWIVYGAKSIVTNELCVKFRGHFNQSADYFTHTKKIKIKI